MVGYGVFLCLFLFSYAFSLFFVFNFSFIHNKHVFPGVQIQQIPFHRMAKEQRAKSQQQHQYQQQQQQQHRHRHKCIWRELKYFSSEEEKTLSRNHMTFLLICCYGCGLVLVHVLSASDFLQNRWKTWTSLNMNIITGVNSYFSSLNFGKILYYAWCFGLFFSIKNAKNILPVWQYFFSTFFLSKSAQQNWRPIFIIRFQHHRKHIEFSLSFPEILGIEYS